MLKRATLVLAILSLTSAVLPMVEASNRPRNIILFGWDGAQREHVTECINRSKLPNLQKLIDEGTIVEIDIEGKTDTKAGWSQILSGYYPEVTGVYSDQQYKPIPKGLSIFERLKAHFGPDKFVTVAVIGDSDDLGTAGPKKTAVTDESRSSQTTAATSEGRKNAKNPANQSNAGKKQSRRASY